MVNTQLSWIIVIVIAVLLFWWFSSQCKRNEGFGSKGDDTFKYYSGEQTGVNEVCFQFTSGSNKDKCNAYVKKLYEESLHKTGGTSEDFNRGVITGIQKGCFIFADRDKTDQCYAYLKQVEKDLKGIAGDSISDPRGSVCPFHRWDRNEGFGSKGDIHYPHVNSCLHCMAHCPPFNPEYGKCMQKCREGPCKKKNI